MTSTHEERRMRMHRVVAGMLVALGIAVAGTARSAPEPGTVSVTGRLGWTTFMLGDVDGSIRSARTAFRADTAVSDIIWDEFGGAPNLGIDVDVQLTRKISAGFGFSYQRGHRRHEAARFFVDTLTGDFADEQFEENPSFHAWDVVGTFGLWVPSAPGLHFGLQLGFIRGTYENQTVLFSETSALSKIEFTQGSWDGTGPVLGAFTGYEQSLSGNLAFSVRTGYRYRNVRRPDGLIGLTGFDDNGHYRSFSPGPLAVYQLDPQGDLVHGNPLDLDLSGFYFNIGVSLRLRGE
jgi:hypothetical protein